MPGPCSVAMLMVGRATEAIYRRYHIVDGRISGTRQRDSMIVLAPLEKSQRNRERAVS